MKHPECPYCNSKTPAKRYCPSYGTAICGPCCARNRSWRFCDLDCNYFIDQYPQVPIQVGGSIIGTTDGMSGVPLRVIYYPNVYEFIEAVLRKTLVFLRIGVLEYKIEFDLKFHKKSLKVYGADKWKLPLCIHPLKIFPDNPRYGPLFGIAPPKGGMSLSSNLILKYNSSEQSFFQDSAVGYHALPFGRPRYTGPAPPPPGTYRYFCLPCDLIWSAMNEGSYQIEGQIILGNSPFPKGSIYFLLPFGKVNSSQKPEIRGDGLWFKYASSFQSPASGNLYPFEQIRDAQVITFFPFMGGFGRPDLPLITGEKVEILPASYPLMEISFETQPEKKDIISVITPQEPISFVLKRFLQEGSMYGKVLVHIFNSATSARYIIRASLASGAISSKTEVVDQRQLRTIILDIPQSTSLSGDKYEQLRVVVTKDGINVFDETKEILLAGTQTWISEVEDHGGLWRRPIYETVGFYINPSAPQIEQIIKYAIQRHPLKQLAGIQDKDNLELQVKAIFEAMKDDLQIGYVSTPFTFGCASNQKGQRLRSFQEILESRAGNCIDLSILLASVLESIGIPGGIALMPGHAMPFWYNEKKPGNPIEIVVQSGVSFNKARLDAQNRLGEFKPEQLSWIKTSECRDKGIKPFQEI